MAVMEIAIEPVGTEDFHMHELIARCVKVIEQTGLPYQVGPMSTVVQGTVTQLLDVAAKMHGAARGEEEGAPRVLTTIRIDDVTAGEHSLDDRVKVVEQALAT